MKIFFKIFLTALSLIAVFSCTNTPDCATEGVIHYSAKFNDSTTLTQMDSMYIGESIFSYKTGKSRYDFISIRKDTIIIMYNEKTHKYAVLVDREGQRTAFVNPNLNLDSMNHKRAYHKFEYLNDTKIIADFKCKKALILNKNEKTKRYVYYTPEINAPLVSHLELAYFDLDGYPMEFSQLVDGKELITTVKKVSFKYVDENIFTIPDDYKIEYTR
jgi:hypothetical protein